MTYLNSTTPKPYHICRSWHYIVYRTEICLFFAFLYKFGCYAYSLCSPEIFISIFEFSDNENPTIHANIVSIAFTELKSVEFWFILTYFWLPWQLPWLVENSGSIFEFNNPVYTCEIFRDFLQGIEICAILAYFCPNLVAMATPSTPLKIQVAHLNLRSP